MKSIVFSDIEITSFREFARNTTLRKRALQKKSPLLVQDKRANEFFFLVPQAMYAGLWEMYEDWKDSALLDSVVNEEETGKNWKDLKSDLVL